MNDVDLRDDTPDVNDVEDTTSVDTHQKDAETVTVDLYDAQKGKVPRTGGPYLDDVEAHNAETWRAQQENREPDYDNPPAVVSTVLVPKSQLVERDVDKAHFSDAIEVTNEPVATVEVTVADGFKGEPDPAQGNWDNNMDRVNALKGAKEYEDLVGKPLQENAPVTGSVNAEAANDQKYSDNSDVDSDTDSDADGDDTEIKPLETWDNPGATGDGVNR